jgi:hypothetical protein
LLVVRERFLQSGSHSPICESISFTHHHAPLRVGERGTLLAAPTFHFARSAMSLSRKRAPVKPKSNPAAADIQPVPAVAPAISAVPRERDKGTSHIAAPPQTPADIPEELIAARAYEIWQQRGCPMGHDSHEDWHAARTQLEEERQNWATPRESDKQRGV